MIYGEVPGLTSDKMDRAWEVEVMVTNPDWEVMVANAEWNERPRYLEAARMLGIQLEWLKLRR